MDQEPTKQRDLERTPLLAFVNLLWAGSLAGLLLLALLLGRHLLPGGN